VPPRTSIHHVTLTVRDVEVSADWYARVLGLERLGNTREGPTWRRIVLVGDGFLVGVTAHDGTVDGDTFDEARVGLDHVGFGCADRAELDAWAQHVDGLGIERSAIVASPHAALFTCRDPDGMPVELYCLLRPL